MALRSKGWNMQVFIGGAGPTEPGYGTLRDVVTGFMQTKGGFNGLSRKN